MRTRIAVILTILTILTTWVAGAQTQPAGADELTRPDLNGVISVNPVNKLFVPRILRGYRHVPPRRFGTQFPDPRIWREVMDEQARLKADTIADGIADSDAEGPILIGAPDSTVILTPAPDLEPAIRIPEREDLPVAFGSATPDWLRRSRDTYRLEEDFIYRLMVENPYYIDYAYWKLPKAPKLPEEDFSFRGYLKRLNLPEVKADRPLEVHPDGERINWLHVCNVGLQLSQAYVSSNWYQGGTSHLAVLANFLWDVQLNNVYYPKLIFQSAVSYKLSVNSTPDDQYHEYSVSQDLFQYNLKLGYKAVKHWYYSFAAQFKTQFFNSYPANSETRSASFLSPGELNLGLGMTYTKENEAKTLKFSATVSPASYNLKTCIDPKVDPVQFGIRAGRKWLNEVGSNAEVNFMAKLWGNTTYTTRLFLFSDYKTFQGDWENTLNFQFSRLFSTQIYAHLRYDSSADSSVSRRWRKLMLKEILSVGISYTFSTK